MTETTTIPVPDVNFAEITTSSATMRATKEHLVIDLGFTTLEIPWHCMQIWNFPASKDASGNVVKAYNPVQLYRGEHQYGVAFSSGDIKSGGNIRCFASKIKLMCNVPRNLFVYIATVNGMKEMIPTWEADAEEYNPSANDNSSSTSTDDETEF